MYLPHSLESIAATSTTMFYLYASLSGNRPNGKWSTQVGISSEISCRSLCTALSLEECSQYLYNIDSSICSFSEDSGSDQLVIKSPSSPNFIYARKVFQNTANFVTL